MAAVGGSQVAEADTRATRHRATRTREVARRRVNATRVSEVRIQGRAVVRRDRRRKCRIQVSYCRELSEVEERGGVVFFTRENVVRIHDRAVVRPDRRRKCRIRGSAQPFDFIVFPKIVTFERVKLFAWFGGNIISKEIFPLIQFKQINIYVFCLI